ncbi:hypothetical protein DPEC_G00035200 [Dallia pectoralis]|uniref:Uncharacterized protein n=1 Tax=Dallia pectoralis TaxID=75939 RepID=A0ACC2HDI2_DALPE|nr:hypothetical protein DPEC_G00035200 [Dallia pectoralis]
MDLDQCTSSSIKHPTLLPGQNLSSRDWGHPDLHMLEAQYMPANVITNTLLGLFGLGFQPSLASLRQKRDPGRMDVGRCMPQTPWLDRVCPIQSALTSARSSVVNHSFTYRNERLDDLKRPKAQ